MIKPYYDQDGITIYHGDCREILPDLPKVDLVLTDPPYGISFMGKAWDKALPDINIWKECLRVLKPGALAFVMSIPRQDCLSRMIISLEDAGFRVDFTPMYWAYASGFPKAQNIGKAVDKRLGAEREVVGREKVDIGIQSGSMHAGRSVNVVEVDKTVATSPQAKAMDGSYGGFQPKPAVEVIIVCMKPLSEKTYVDQALKNGKGITWLDDCRVPYESEGDFKENWRQEKGSDSAFFDSANGKGIQTNPQGRFPANLLVSDDVLNDGRVSKSPSTYIRKADGFGKSSYKVGEPAGKESLNYGDSGSFSRYFDLDKWAQKTFPFLIVPKASKSEKNKGLDGRKSPVAERAGRDNTMNSKYTPEGKPQSISPPERNNHPTVKPIKLMSYLITLGSREGDVVLDPFLGSGTTALASKLLGRKCIGIELEEKYCEIAVKRLSQSVMQLEPA